MDNRFEEMTSQVRAFHEKHPLVWDLFVQFTNELIAKGFNNYSSKAVFERIRWETDQADVDGKSTFKLNNNYTAFYARRFMWMYPQHKGFFRTRVQISIFKNATDLPELTPQDFI